MRNTGSGKTAQFKSMDDADAFYVNLKANDIDPLRKYMFGKPAEGENHHPVIFNVSDYDNANNILVTLFWDKAGTSRFINWFGFSRNRPVNIFRQPFF